MKYLIRFSGHLKSIEYRNWDMFFATKREYTEWLRNPTIGGEQLTLVHFTLFRIYLTKLKTKQCIT